VDEPALQFFSLSIFTHEINFRDGMGWDGCEGYEVMVASFLCKWLMINREGFSALWLSLRTWTTNTSLASSAVGDLRATSSPHTLFNRLKGISLKGKVATCPKKKGKKEKRKDELLRDQGGIRGGAEWD